ncbi:MAG: hypothetical protein ACPGVB_08155, partial [Chitinophagales bacterium]
NSLKDLVTEARMSPISELGQQLRRATRDLSSKLAKEIKFELPKNVRFLEGIEEVLGFVDEKK